MNPQTKNDQTGATQKGGSFHFGEVQGEGVKTGDAARRKLQGKAGESPLRGVKVKPSGLRPAAANLDTPGTSAGRCPAVHTGRRAGHQQLKKEYMENSIQTTGGQLVAVHTRRQTAPAVVPNPDLSVPARGTTGPVPIGEVMEPIRRIIDHPDRDRLLAEFFKRHW